MKAGCGTGSWPDYTSQYPITFSILQRSSLACQPQLKQHMCLQVRKSSSSNFTNQDGRHNCWLLLLIRTPNASTLQLFLFSAPIFSSSSLCLFGFYLKEYNSWCMSEIGPERQAWEKKSTSRYNSVTLDQ